MLTMKWHPMRMITLMLAFLGVMTKSANADAVRDGPKVGRWKTWVLTSGKEIQVPAPPPETSDRTKAELAELRQLQKERSPSANTAIQYYNAVPATQRWHDIAHTIARAEKQSLNRQAWMASILAACPSHAPGAVVAIPVALYFAAPGLSHLSRQGLRGSRYQREAGAPPAVGGLQLPPRIEQPCLPHLRKNVNIPVRYSSIPLGI